MRIAFIVGQFPVLSETFVINQIAGLIARGHEVNIYGTQPNEQFKVHPDVEKYHLIDRTRYQIKVPQNYFWRLLKGLRLIFANWQIYHLTILRSLNFWKYGRRAFSLRLLYSVISILDSQPYDIIHCQFGTLGLDGMILREIGAIKGKLITSFRGYDISLFIKQHGENVYNALFAQGDFFLANCDYFQKRAIRLGCNKKKIVVHGSGIDCSRFPFQARYPDYNGTIRIATIGRLVEKKGIEYSISAVAKVAKSYQNIEYNIIGDGILKEDLQQLIQSLNISHKVKLLGWKNQLEIIDILDKSHIFMAPSVTARNGDQDAPVNTLKEAMIMGLPVIATLHGGIPELVENGVSGFLVPEKDADAIAEKLTHLIEHPEIWPSIGQAGRAYVKSHYDLNELNDKLVHIYQQLLSKDALEEQDLASASKLRYKV